MILLFLVNSVLTSLLSVFTRAHKEKIANRFQPGAPIVISWPNFFNPCPSFSSVATDDRKQFQCLNIVLK